MRHFIAVAALVLLGIAGPAGAQMTMTGAGCAAAACVSATNNFVLKQHVLGKGQNAPVTTAASFTGSNLLVLTATWTTGSPCTTTCAPTDSSSNTWVAGCNVQDAGQQTETKVWYVYSPTVTGSQTFTFASGINNVYAMFNVVGFSGAVSSPYDQCTGFDQEGGLTTIQPGSITPSANGELVVTTLGSSDAGGGTYSVNGGYAITDQIGFGGSYYGGAAAYLLQTTAAATNPTWTTTGATVNGQQAVIASFK